MKNPIPAHDDYEAWHRRLCPVTDWLVLSGDLDHVRRRAERQVHEWRAAGITDIIDVREEWNDRELVAELASELHYWHFGTHDDGGRQDDAWFEAGVDAYREAIAKPEARLLVHCHMGINRGPSMGYRLMLEAGEDPVAALVAIRRARPIAAIAYAGDALDRFHRLTNASQRTRERDRNGLSVWMNDPRNDTGTVIRRIRTGVV